MTAKLLTKAEVCARLGISKTTLATWPKSGPVPAPIAVGRVRRWPEAAIDAAIDRLAAAANV